MLLERLPCGTFSIFLQSYTLQVHIINSYLEYLSVKLILLVLPVAQMYHLVVNVAFCHVILIARSLSLQASELDYVMFCLVNTC
uniref:Uncharacterized protein n=1 Tax=Arundo donax TaxID=35708 RepID=A0A0A9HMS2_ARUDO